MVRRRKNKPNVAARPRAAAARWPAFVFGFVAGAVAMLVVDALGPGREGGTEGAPGSEEGVGEESASQITRFEFYHILPEMEVALPHLENGEAAPAPAETPTETTEVAAKPAEAAAETEQPPESPAATEPAPAAEEAETPTETAEVAAEPAAPPVKPAEAAASPSETVADAGSVYVLQVGSFRSLDDADGMRARLALLGLEAVVQTVAIDGETAWHRVRVGPYTELRALNRARIRLR